MKLFIRSIDLLLVVLMLQICCLANAGTSKDFYSNNVDKKILKLFPDPAEINKLNFEDEKIMLNQALANAKDLKSKKDVVVGLANEGNTEAMIYFVAKIYHLQENKKFEDALSLLMKSANLGNPKACMLLSVLYSSGTIYGTYYDVKVDPPTSLKYALMAAYNGSKLGQERVSVFQLIGYGADENLENAMAWANLAKDGGSDWVKYFLEKYSTDRKLVHSILIEEAKFYAEKKDYSFVKKLLEFLIANGDSEIINLATNEMAKLHIDMRNHKEAFIWYKKSAELGEVGAKLHLAKIYDGLFKDYGVPKNEELAKYWYAAVVNDSSATDWQKSSAKNGFNTITWQAEIKKVLSSAKSFNIKVTCTDQIYISSRNSYEAMGDERGMMAVEAFYAMGADIDQNAYQAFSKTPYICSLNKSNISVNRIKIIGRSRDGKYLIKIDSKNIYSAINL